MSSFWGPLQALNRTTSIWGSYLGELIRKKLGGTWINEESRRWMLVNNFKISPIEYIYKRITAQLQVNVKDYFDDVVIKLSSQPISFVQPAPNLPKNAYTSTNQSQIQERTKPELPKSIDRSSQSKVQEPKADTSTVAVNKKLIRTIGIIGGIILTGFVFIITLSFFKNLLGGSREFNSNLQLFLAEGEKLNIMTGQGVNNADYRNQLAQVKSKYSMLGNSWPPSLVNNKVLFDKAMTGWDLTLVIWDDKIKGVGSAYYFLPSDLKGKCESYTDTKHSSADDCISAIMGLASNYFEEGRANITP